MDQDAHGALDNMDAGGHGRRERRRCRNRLSSSLGSWHTMSLGDKLSFDPTSVSLTGLLFSQLIIGVLGVLVMSAEYGTGTIRSTLAAVPNRPLVLATKAAVLAIVTLVVSELLSFSAFLLGQALLRSPVPHATLSQPGVLRAVVGADWQ